MAPLSESNNTFCFTNSSEDGSKVYEGFADPEWAVKQVTLGGFSLSAILDAALQFQSETSHPDPYHVSSQFLHTVTPGVFQVRIRSIQTGTRFANLIAEFWQKERLKILCQLVFTDFDVISDSDGPILPETLSSLHPLHTHPSQAQVSDRLLASDLNKRYSWAKESATGERNSTMTKEGKQPEGMTWGAWIELHERPEVPMSASWIPFFVDMTETTRDVLPNDVNGGIIWWPPSISIVIDFKCSLPLPSRYAPHTLGVFTRIQHIKDGLWNNSSEIWSAPSALADANPEVDEAWREKMVCVAVASQVASIEPLNGQTRYEDRVDSFYAEQAKL
ncbi:hypothetical protein FS837_008791 [Tulasnella sp. UAMH 9824]|nr:hypothetical protein FS837_008791 [Tulasnella sp. UAMH 9824]